MASNGDGAVRWDQTSDFQLLINSTPILVDTAKPDGYLDFWNQTWLSYVGHSLEDLAGWKWTAFIDPEDAQRTGYFGSQGTVTNIDPTAAALLPLIPRANVGTNEFVSSPVQLLRATSKDAGAGRLCTCSRKLIPPRGKMPFISTNRTCWNKA